jgi:RNA polymerase sigma-70 factor (ECF subfamily)
MENYTKQSYEPVNLHIWFSGWSGVNGRPSSLTTGGLIAQNLLYLAYKEPITESELSKAIGIPAAYVEPIIKQLVDDELMRRIGDKVYTDFIITTKADREKYVPAQKQFFAENSNVFMKAIKEGLKKIKSLNFYSRFTVNQQNALDLYFMFNCLEGYSTHFQKYMKTCRLSPTARTGVNGLPLAIYIRRVMRAIQPDFHIHMLGGAMQS